METTNENKLICPVESVPDDLAFERTEFTSLVEFIQSDERVGESRTFEKGTVTPIGQLDCCKQDLGPAGARLLTESLKRNTTIKSILFGTGAIGDAGAESVGDLLKENDTIETVYLGCNLIEAKGVEALADGLRENTSVHALWFKRNPIGSGGIKALIRLFETNRNIRTLDLVNTGFDLKDLNSLVDALVQTDYPLERLYLSGNHLGPEASPALVRLIAANRHLKELYLSVNQFGDEGLNALAPGLNDTRTLRLLSLSSNGLTHRGLPAFLDAMSDYCTMEALDFGRLPSTRVLGAEPNAIGDQGAKLLAKFLGASNAMKQLDIRTNRIGVVGLWAICEALKTNTSLVDLKYSSVRSDKIRKTLPDLLERNRRQQPPVEVAADVKSIKSVYR